MPHRKSNINKEIVSLFSGFSGQSNTLSVPRLYVELTGSYSLGVVLNQCVFWSNKSKKGEGWFYKTYEEWFEEIHIQERTLRRHFDKLEAAGWITTKVKKIHGVNTKHIFTHTERIIDSLQGLVLKNNPDQPLCPDGANIEQSSCMKSVPSGQDVRSEPDILSGSTIYTDNNIQITKNCEDPSSSFFLPKK